MNNLTGFPVEYTLQYRILNTNHFGVPQKRERIFIVGTLGDLQFEFPKDLYYGIY